MFANGIPTHGVDFAKMAKIDFINMNSHYVAKSDKKLLHIPRGGAPCFRIGGAEDNFIFYIEYCFFFVPVLKLR